MTEPHIETFSFPPLEDTEYWERNIAAGLHQPMSEAELAEIRGETPAGYQWVDLASPQYATPPDPPAIEGILYAGRRHVLSGPPESLKTLVAYLLLLSALRAGEGVAILDFEMGPHAAATLLRELGATDDELQAIHYTEPQGPPADNDIDRLERLGVGYVLVDAAAGAYDTTGLDDNARKDAEQFAAKWIRPLWQAGIATIVIDHVTKNTKTRGKFTIGSERKTGQADVHLSLEALKPLHRGSDGLVKMRVHKDRPGHLERPTAAMIKLDSDPDNHHVTWTFQTVEHTDDEDGFRPTRLMERVSRYLGQQHTPQSRNSIHQAVGGRKQWVLAAINVLCREGFSSDVENGVQHVRQYLESDDQTLNREPVPGGSQPVPGTGDPEVVPVVPAGSPPHGGPGTTEPPHRPPGTEQVVPGSGPTKEIMF